MTPPPPKKNIHKTVITPKIFIFLTPPPPPPPILKFKILKKNDPSPGHSAPTANFSFSGIVGYPLSSKWSRSWAIDKLCFPNYGLPLLAISYILFYFLGHSLPLGLNIFYCQNIYSYGVGSQVFKASSGWGCPFCHPWVQHSVYPPPPPQKKTKQKKNWNFSNPIKYPPFCILTLRKDHRMHRN